MNSYFAASLLDHIFQSCLKDFYSAALMDSGGLPLSIKYQNLTDIGTFPTAAMISDQYMNIADGDVILLNDPYSGGSILSTMTLIMGIHIPFGSRKVDVTKLLLCARVAFKPRVKTTETIEDEGIRIPPSPIKMSGQLNNELFEIIGQHPSCPLYFKDYICKTIEQMDVAKTQLIQNLNLTNTKLNKKSLQEFHQTAYERAKRSISDISIGEASIEIPLTEKNEKLALRVEVQEDKITFDFTNTTACKSLHLTDTATLGACAGAVYSCLNEPVPMNSGSLKTIDVVAPQGSMVNAKYPEPVFLGLTDGTALIASIAIQLIGTIDQRKKMAQSGFAQCSLEIDFGSEHPHYFDCLESGVAATQERKGLSAFDLWKRSHLSPSIENAEEKLPIKVLSNAYRQKSGGSGNKEGGNGVTRTIEILKPGALTWAISPPTGKPEGILGGKAASPPEIFIQKPGEQKQKLEPMGKMQIPEHTHIIMNSAGGGGAGELIEETEE